MIKNKTKRGFTLMELLIAVAALALVMIATISLFSSSYQMGNDANVIQRDVENLNFAMEQMSKSIRMTGTQTDDVGGDVTEFFDTSAGNEIVFYNYSEDRCIGYKIEDDAIWKAESAAGWVESSGNDREDCDSSSVGSYDEITPEFDTMDQLTGSFERIEDNSNVIVILVQAKLEKNSRVFPAGEMKIETAVAVRNLPVVTP